MNIATISTYVQEFLHTTDPKTIANIPIFISNAASRVASEFRNSILELAFTGAALESQALPADFISTVYVEADGYPLTWQSINDLSALKAIEAEDLAVPAHPAYYSIAGRMLQIYPAPGTSVSMIYLGLSQDNPEILASQLPAMLIQGAVAEGQKYEGDLEGSADSMGDFYNQLQRAKGWEISAPISLGGVR
jgi:hypothetical protein